MTRLGPACVSGRLALARPNSVCRTPHSFTLCRSLRSSHRSCSDGLHCRGQEGAVRAGEEVRKRRRRQRERTGQEGEEREKEGGEEKEEHEEREEEKEEEEGK